MSYGAKIIGTDEVVQIVEKGYDGDTQILVDDQGNTYKMSEEYGEAGVTPYTIGENTAADTVEAAPLEDDDKPAKK